jgi:outer membrane immunogenic protein
MEGLLESKLVSGTAISMRTRRREGAVVFRFTGGYGTFIYHLNRNWGLAADFSAGHANNIDSTTQSITTFDYLAGPRYTVGTRKTAPYAQALAGGAEERSNYAYVKNANAFGFLAGGGINTTINYRFGWNIVEADWVYSRLPNGVNTHQNVLRISSGITLRFGSAGGTAHR